MLNNQIKSQIQKIKLLTSHFLSLKFGSYSLHFIINLVECFSMFLFSFQKLVTLTQIQSFFLIIKRKLKKNI